MGEGKKAMKFCCRPDPCFVIEKLLWLMRGVMKRPGGGNHETCGGDDFELEREQSRFWKKEEHLFQFQLLVNSHLCLQATCQVSLLAK